MANSPGHKKWPDHKVIEDRPAARMQVHFNGQKVADSTDVIRVAEDGHPNRFYFPRQDVRMELLERTEATTQCPFKGTAHYYSLKVGDRVEENAIWTYEDPYDEHRDLKDRLAFYDEKMDEVKTLAA